MRKKTDLLELCFIGLSSIKDKCRYLLPLVVVLLFILIFYPMPAGAAEGDAIRNTGVMGDVNQDFQDKDL